MKTVTLPNGVKVLLAHRSNKTLCVSATIAVGHNNENETTLGLSSLYEQVLLKQLNGFYARYGGTITSYITECDKSNLPLVLDRLAKAFMAPAFDKAEVAAVAADIVQHTQDRAPLVRRQMELLYKHTAYANKEVVWDTAFYVSSVLRHSTNLGSLIAFKEKYYVGSNLIISVCGEYGEADAVFEQIAQKFADIPAGKKSEVENNLYTGGYGKIFSPYSNHIMLGWDIADLQNEPAAYVLIPMLNSRLERAFVGTDVVANAHISGYYGRRTLRIVLESHQLDINHVLDVLCAVVIRLKTTEANDRRLETSKQRAMVDKLMVFEDTREASHEIAWQLLGRNTVYDFGQRIMGISEVTSRDVQEMAESIFNNSLPTLVVGARDDKHYSFDEVLGKLQ